MLNTTAFTDLPVGVKIISGKKLQGARRRYSRTVRSLLAEGLVNGSVVLKDLTPRQAASITRVRMVDARTVRTATPLEHAALRQGAATVEAVRREQLANKPISDRRLHRLIERAGVGRVLDLLDEMTKPAAPEKSNGQDAAALGHVLGVL